MAWLVRQDPGHKDDLSELEVLVEPISDEAMIADVPDKSARFYGILNELLTGAERV